MPQLYMSFANEDGFLGAIVLEAVDVIEGARKAHQLGINPGGEVLAVLVPEDKIIREEFVGRLLNREEAENLTFENKEIKIVDKKEN